MLGGCFTTHWWDYWISKSRVDRLKRFLLVNLEVSHPSFFFLLSLVYIQCQLFQSPRLGKVTIGCRAPLFLRFERTFNHRIRFSVAPPQPFRTTKTTQKLEWLIPWLPPLSATRAVTIDSCQLGEVGANSRVLPQDIVVKVLKRLCFVLELTKVRSQTKTCFQTVARPNFDSWSPTKVGVAIDTRKTFTTPNGTRRQKIDFHPR